MALVSALESVAYMWFWFVQPKRLQWFRSAARAINPRAGARLSLVRPEALRRMRVFHCCTCKSYMVHVSVASSQFRTAQGKGEEGCVLHWGRTCAYWHPVLYCSLDNRGRLSMCLRAGSSLTREPGKVAEQMTWNRTSFSFAMCVHK